VQEAFGGPGWQESRAGEQEERRTVGEAGEQGERSTVGEAGEHDESTVEKPGEPEVESS
jgi:hypothetical protein